MGLSYSNATCFFMKISENSAQGVVIGNLYVLDPDNVNGDRQQYDCEVVNDVPFKVW